MGEPVTGKKDEVSTTAPTAGAETTPAIASDGAADVAPTSATPKTPATGTMSSKASKRNSVFGGLFGKKDTPKSGATETAPAVPAKDLPAKDTPSTVASTAPQLDNPVTSPTASTTPGAATDAPTTAPTGTTAGTTEPAVEKTIEPAAGSTAAPVAATTTTSSSTTPTDKRRTSFFSGRGTKKEKNAGATSGDELTDGETKKSGGVGGLLRKASRAVSKPAASSATGASATKPAVPTAAESADKSAEKTVDKTADKTAETKAADPFEVPLPKTEPAAGSLPNGTEAATSGEKSDLTPGEIGSNAITSHEKTTPVEATA